MLSILLSTQLFAVPNSILFCRIVCTEIARQHRLVVIDPNTHIDPIGDALKKLHKCDGVCKVDSSDPKSLQSFISDLEQTIAHVGTKEQRLGAIAEFQKRWNVPDAQLFDILFAYYRHAPSGTRLREIYAPQEYEQWERWAKYQQFLEDYPKLKERYEFYLRNVGELSVPEMTRLLRDSGDTGLTEGRVYSEIRSFQISLEERFDNPLTVGQRARLAQFKLANTVLTVAEAVQALHELSVPIDEIAKAFDVTSQELRFFMHFNHVKRRVVSWDRIVEDEKGNRLSESEYLKTLYLTGRYTHADLAELMNLAAQRAQKEHIGPGHAEFRSLSMITNQLIAQGLTPASPHSTHTLQIPPFGYVVRDGHLQIPGAVRFIAEQRNLGKSLVDMEQMLGVDAVTIKRFEATYSSLYSTGVPTYLRRFLKADSHVRTRQKVEVPNPGEDPGFENFAAQVDVFRNGFQISGVRTFVENFSKIGIRLGDVQRAEWETYVKGMNPSSGVTANPERSDKPESTKRLNQYYLFQAMKKYVELWNATREPKDHLRLENVVSEKTAQEFVKKIDPDFIVRVSGMPAPTDPHPFNDFTPNAGYFLQLLKLRTPRFQNELTDWGKYFRDEDLAQWIAFVSTIPQTAANHASPDVAGHNPVTIRLNQFYVFSAVQKFIEFYNKNPKNEQKIEVGALENKSKILKLAKLIKPKTQEILGAPPEPTVEHPFNQFIPHIGKVLAELKLKTNDGLHESIKGWGKALSNDKFQEWEEFVAEIPKTAGINSSPEKTSIQESSRRRNQYYIYLAIEKFYSLRGEPVDLGKLESINSFIELVR